MMAIEIGFNHVALENGHSSMTPVRRPSDRPGDALIVAEGGPHHLDGSVAVREARDSPTTLAVA